jgi:hypothetical protein
MDWLSQLPGTAQPFLDAMWNGLVLAYDWAKEWQILLAGLLVLLAALIVARAIRKTAAILPAGEPQQQADLRLAENPAVSDAPGTPQELVGSLDQLRSVIRSALASFTLTTTNLAVEQENSPAYFLCQRIAHLRLERFPLPANAGKTAREQHAALLQQLELLRVHLRKNARPEEISEILVRLNASARNLTAALAPAADSRLQANSETR